MRCWQRLLTLGVLGASLALPTSAKPVLTWLVQNVPPFFSYAEGRAPLSAAELGPGERALFLRLLIEQLPQYQHVFIEASLPRFERMLSQGQTICSVLHKRLPERLANRYFTPMHPVIGSRQIQLLLRRDRLARFQALGTPVPLARLWEAGDLRGLVERDRSFGGTLDSALKPALGKGMDTVVVSNKATLLNMLLAGRMDYTLEYPDAIAATLDPGQAQELVALPIAEADRAELAHASCSRTAEGLARVQAIDAAIRRLAQNPQRELWLRGLLGESPSAAERARQERFLNERAQRGPQIE
jgi:uncharacterized protein (TIGR02285 family)